MRHLGNYDYPEIVKVLKLRREVWGDQVFIGPPSENASGHLIGMYLEESSIPLLEQGQEA